MPNDVLERLRRANPVPGDLPAPPLEPLLDRLDATPARPPARGLGSVVGLSLAIAVVVLVAAVALDTAGNGHRAASPGATTPTRSSRVVLQARATKGGAPSGQAIRQAVSVLDRRLGSISSRLHASVSGADQITIAGVSPSERAQVLALTGPGRLLFYDWEADALTSNGKSVASQLTAHSPDALKISQGENNGPGSPDGGGVSLYQAVKLASKQPLVQAGGSRQLSREGAQYYLFGAPGSAACTTLAKQDGTAPIPGAHCLLAGPAASVSDLQADLPPGTTMADGDRLTVPQGTVVLQAVNPTATDQISLDSPSTRFYVLKDNVALTGHQITDPHPSTDTAGSPDVAFNFTAKGKSQFQKLTAQIAHRGQISSTPKQMLDQHFAVALDTQLITVSSIDYQSYPDGVTGGNGAELAGGFSTRTARETAALLRDGVLAVSLTPQQ
jgi:SecD/SecF fusion protein